MDFRSQTSPVTVTDFFAEYKCFRDFLHGFPFLTALALDTEIGLFFGHSQISLQDSLRTLHDFAGFQALRKIGILGSKRASSISAPARDPTVHSNRILREL